MLKKILLPLIVGILLIGLVLPIVSLAQQPVPESCTMTRNVGITNCPTTGACVYETNPKCGFCCFMQTLYVVTDWIFAILIAIAAIMVLFGAFTLVTAAGAPEKVTSGRNYILYAAIGLIIAFLAKAIPAIVKTVAGV